MATTNKGSTSIEITGIAADWDWAVEVDENDSSPRIVSITFVPGAADDVMVIKEGSDTGPVFFMATCLTADEKIQYFNGNRKWIYIDFNLCTLSAGHKVLIDLWKYSE